MGFYLAFAIFHDFYKNSFIKTQNEFFAYQDEKDSYKKKRKKNLEKIENAVAKGWLHSTTIKHNFDETFNPLCFTSVNCEILMWLVRFVF